MGFEATVGEPTVLQTVPRTTVTSPNTSLSTTFGVYSAYSAWTAYNLTMVAYPRLR